MEVRILGQKNRQSQVELIVLNIDENLEYKDWVRCVYSEIYCVSNVQDIQDEYCRCSGGDGAYLQYDSH